MHTEPEAPATPSFVVDQPTLDRFCHRFERALAAHWPGSVVAYSLKTNSLPWLLSYMRERGAWAEVVSDTEYELALAVGYPPDRIVFNGPVKGRDRLRMALAEGSVVNLDSQREVRWACEFARERRDREFAVGIRVNWDLQARCPGESATPDEGGRFGFTVEHGQFDTALAQLRSAGVRLAGLHLHTSSVSRSYQVFQAAATVAAEIITARGLDLDFVDIGGGFFGSEDAGAPTFDGYFDVVRRVLSAVVDPARTRLIVEPGQCLVAVPVEFHTSVVDVKRVGPRTVVVTDGSRSNLDPMYRRRAPYDYTLSTSAGTTVEVQIVSGYTCMEHDRIMRLQNAPALAEGDRVVYAKVGAYSMSLQPLFIEYPPPVYVRGADGRLHLVRRRWGAHEYLQGSIHLDTPGEVEDSSPQSVPLGSDRVRTKASRRTEVTPVS